MHKLISLTLLSVGVALTQLSASQALTLQDSKSSPWILTSISTPAPLDAPDNDAHKILDPDALANKAKMLVNANQNDQAKALVQTTVTAGKYSRDIYRAKLLRLLPQDLVDNWLNQVI